ncbi:MAG TPA: DUF1045 domain-containing protein [Devosiaceae bacterium]|jgi:hypothetical protein
MRCAIYFIPPAQSDLTLAAAEWLRRDPYTGARVSAAVEGLTEDDHAFLTAVPRRYGFHGTLKAPFHLVPGRSLDDLQRKLDAICGSLQPVTVNTRIGRVGTIFALLPTRPDADLDAVAARIVTEVDAFRSPLTDDELERRDLSRLSGRQLAHLLAWGSPHVFDEFRFHMTLTSPVPPLERDHVATVLTRHFGPLAEAPLEIGQLALCVEPEPYAPFLVHSVHKFCLQRQRKIA